MVCYPRIGGIQMEVYTKRYEKDDKYIIYSDGKVFSEYSNKFLKMSAIPNTRGYLSYTLAGKTMPIHRIIAETFIPNPDNLMQVHHLDNDPTNNSVDNLQWISVDDNLAEMRDRHGDTSQQAREALAKVSGKAVDQYTLDGKLVNSFRSAKEASESVPGTLQSKIGSVANGRRKSHAGYKWVWHDPSQKYRSIPKENRFD